MQPLSSIKWYKDQFRGKVAAAGTLLKSKTLSLLCCYFLTEYQAAGFIPGEDLISFRYQFQDDSTSPYYYFHNDRAVKQDSFENFGTYIAAFRSRRV